MDSRSIIAARVAAFADDREHGATELAREALHILRKAAQGGASAGELRAIAEQLVAAKPTMAAVKNVMGRTRQQLAGETTPAEAVAVCDQVSRWVERATESVLDRAVRAIPADAILLTCSYSSTVAAVCGRTQQMGKRPIVWAMESRVAARSYAAQLSAVLARAGVRCDVLADSSAALAAPRASLAMVGADRILPDGSFINGTPTLVLAKACYGHIPLWVVAESFKIDDADEVEPGFDRVPLGLVTRYVTEQGSVTPDRIWKLRERQRKAEAAEG